MLAARFYDPGDGSIGLDGSKYPDIGTKELMKRVAIVFQESQLFKGTIEDNIRMGNRKAGPDDIGRAAGRPRRTSSSTPCPRATPPRCPGTRPCPAARSSAWP